MFTPWTLMNSTKMNSEGASMCNTYQMDCSQKWVTFFWMLNNWMHWSELSKETSHKWSSWDLSPDSWGTATHSDMLQRSWEALQGKKRSSRWSTASDKGVASFSWQWHLTSQSPYQHRICSLLYSAVSLIDLVLLRKSVIALEKMVRCQLTAVRGMYIESSHCANQIRFIGSDYACIDDANGVGAETHILICMQYMMRLIVHSNAAPVMHDYIEVNKNPTMKMAILLQLLYNEQGYIQPYINHVSSHGVHQLHKKTPWYSTDY